MAVVSGNEKCLSWSEDPDCVEFWDTTEFTWSDCILIDEIIDVGGGGSGALPPPHNVSWWNQKDTKKITPKQKECKDRLIRLIATVKKEIYYQEILTNDCIGDYEIKIEDVHLVKKELEKKLNIDNIRLMKNKLEKTLSINDIRLVKAEVEKILTMDDVYLIKHDLKKILNMNDLQLVKSDLKKILNVTVENNI